MELKAPRTTAEQHLHELFRELESYVGGHDTHVRDERLRAGLEKLTLSAFSEPKAFRVEYTSHALSTVNDPLIPWQGRLTRRKIEEGCEFEHFWMNVGALLYVEHGHPANAIYLVDKYRDQLQKGPPTDCPLQQETDCLLTAYIFVRAYSIWDQEASGADSATSTAWKWVEPAGPPSDGSGSAGPATRLRVPRSPTSTFDVVLNRLLRFYVATEILFHRLRQNSPKVTNDGDLNIDDDKLRAAVEI